MAPTFQFIISCHNGIAYSNGVSFHFTLHHTLTRYPMPRTAFLARTAAVNQYGGSDQRRV